MTNSLPFNPMVLEIPYLKLTQNLKTLSQTASTWELSQVGFDTTCNITGPNLKVLPEGEFQAHKTK